MVDVHVVERGKSIASDRVWKINFIHGYPVCFFCILNEIVCTLFQQEDQEKDRFD